jgi:hypothetical protein
MRETSRSAWAKRDIKTRQHLMERSFARGTWYGFDRARWRRLWRVQIQEYMIATIQNIEILLRLGEEPKKGLFVRVNQVIQGVKQPISGMVNGLMTAQSKKTMPLDLVCGLNRI